MLALEEVISLLKIIQGYTNLKIISPTVIQSSRCFISRLGLIRTRRQRFYFNLSS